MSRPSYYLVNHTRKEFHYFENRQSIFKILQESLAAYPEWKDTDDIRIKSELSDSTDLIDHFLNDLEYKDLQAVAEGACIGCDEPIECGAQGYCAMCWNERYGYEEEKDEKEEDETCIECNDPIVGGAKGYCEQCWQRTFRCEDDCE